jgi:Ala-tRNA(Pro) deacylase
MIVEPLREFLGSRGVHYHVHEHSARITAPEVAAETHISGRRFAKSVLLRVPRDSKPTFVLAVVPANEIVDLPSLRRMLGEPLEMASEEDFARVFPGFEVGAAPPIGELAATPLEVIVDVCLAEGDGVAMNGGTHTEVVEMPWSEYARIATFRVVECGRRPAPPQPEARA